MKKLDKKTILKPVSVALDRAFTNRLIKRSGLKAARVIIDRYTNNGTDVSLSGKRHFGGSWDFMLDTPKLEKTSDRKAYISGWFVPHEEVKYALRLVSPKGRKEEIRSDIKRYDVAEVLSSRLDRKVSLSCGFGKNIVVDEDGSYVIEVKIHGSWKRLVEFNLRYDPDFVVSDIFNGNMAQNAAAHANLISNKKMYFHEQASDVEFAPDSSDARLVAFYLPQFHPFEQNDRWWGKGFTEWSNVASAIPRYVGHEQPKLPADLGFYDLRLPENMKSQIDLAKRHGVNAFCFYYYWFSGERLMERPLDMFLAHKEWDFNYMICWANENWTRRWDGRNQDVLIAQQHNEDDPLRFIKDVESILLDERYVRVDGKPVLAVYRASELGDTAGYAKVWRDYFKKTHGLELHLLSVQGFSDDNPATFGFDKGIEFVPLSVSNRLKKDIPRYSIVDKMLDVEFTGAMYDYRGVALDFFNKKPKDGSYRSVMPAWDNDARRKGSGGVFANANPDLYGRWLDELLQQVEQDAPSVDQKMIFINAWNEWAEGAYLEPDSMYGHAYLNRTAQVLAKHSKNADNRQAFPLYNIRRSEGVNTAVILHLYYTDMWQEFEKRLKKMHHLQFDLFVTIPKRSEHFRDQILKSFPAAQVYIVPNRGRDVLPFLHLARRLSEVGYQNFLKVHSKKSIHRSDGDGWIKDMLGKLMPDSPEQIKGLMTTLGQESTGIVGPYGHYISLDTYFGANEDKTFDLLDRCVGKKKAAKVIKRIDEYGFFAGTMFWGRFDAIEPLLNQYFQTADFEAEQGQVDGTFAHAVERVLTVLPYVNGKNMYSIDIATILQVTGSGITADYAYAKNKHNQ